MKRLLSITTVLVVGLSVFPISQSSAIFGLSTCEKVKKEVTNIEKNINSKLYYLSGFEGKVLRGKSLSVYNSVINSNFMNELWKIGYNNPKCFTNTQKLIIKQLPSTSKDELIWINKDFKYFDSGKCKDWLTRLGDSSCIKSTTSTLRYSKSWQSLYDY
jgi:hypothetical protein